MSSTQNKLLSVLSVALLMACSAFALICIPADESSAYSGSMDNGKTLTVSYGEDISITNTVNEITFTSVVPTGLPSGLSVSISSDSHAYILSGAATEAGTFSVTLNINVKTSISNESSELKFTLIVTDDRLSITYDSEGGSVSPGVQKANSGTSVTLPSPGTKTGYTFAGWYTAASGGTLVGQAGSSYTVTSSKTLYAQWTAANASLSYNANGGSGAPATQTATCTGSSVSMTVSGGEPSRSGYSFLGWALSSSATSASYYSGSSVTVNAGETKVLYAVWQQVMEITSSHGNSSQTVGKAFSYTLTSNISGGTLTVSGATWLSVSGYTLSGTPTTAGTYNVTLTLAKSGFTSVTESFTVVVSEVLSFSSLPTSGFYLVG